MGLNPFHRALSAFLGKAGRVWRTQVLDFRCAAIREGQPVELPGWLLISADENRVSFLLRRPVLGGGPARPVHIRLARLNGHRKAGHSWLTLARRVAARRPLPGEGRSWQVEQSLTGRTNQVSVRLFPRALAGVEVLELEIREPVRGKRVGRLRFDVFDEARAQRYLVESRRTEAQQLWIESGGERHPGNLVANTSDFVVPEFTLASSQLNALLPAREVCLSWSLAAGQKRLILGRKAIIPDSGAMKIEGGPVSLQNRTLFPQPGPYCLVAAIDGQQVAVFPFRLLDQHEWLEQVQVGPLNIESESVDGQTRCETGALRWGTHIAFRPTLHIAAGVPAPNTPVRCRARILLGGTVLSNEETLVRLDGSSRQLCLRRFSLQQLARSMGARSVRLNLTLHVNEQLKFASPIIVLPAQHLTNFEGQLKCNESELAFDEAEYDEILKRLAPHQRPGKSRHQERCAAG